MPLKIYGGKDARRVKKGDVYGTANIKRLQPDEEGLAKLANYLTKAPDKKKRWSSSQNLVRPHSTTRDSKYRSRRDVENFANNLTVEEVQKRYPGWTVAGKDNGMSAFKNEYTGHSIYLRLMRIDKEERLE